MNPSEILIWVGIVAGSSLIAFVILIVLIRTPKDIKAADLCMVGFATVLIVWSQYSKIQVGKFLILEKKFTQLSTDFATYQGTLRLIEANQIKKDEIMTLSKKVDVLSKNIGTTQTQLTSMQSNLSSVQKAVVEYKKFPFGIAADMALGREPPYKIPEKPSEIPQPMPPKPEISLQPKPEITPEQKPEIGLPPQTEVPAAKPEITPQSKPETPPTKK